MRKVIIRFLSAGALVSAALAAVTAPAPAHAETTACTVIATLPTTITVSGRYCLDQDWVQDYGFTTPIKVNADDVVIDCNGHRIRHTNTANTGTGIHAPNGRHDVTVRNCLLDGWYVAIFMQSSSDPGAHGNRIEDNLVLRSRTTGIYVIGSHNRIERNRVAGNTGDYGVARGIFVSTMDGNAVGNLVRDNIISDFRVVQATPDSGTTVEAINVSNQNHVEVRGNVISGLLNVAGQYTAGIVGYNTYGAVVADNIVMTPPYPGTAPWTGYHAYGIYLYGTAAEMASNTCRDNVIGRYNSPMYGCTSVSNTAF